MSVTKRKFQGLWWMEMLEVGRFAPTNGRKETIGGENANTGFLKQNGRNVCAVGSNGGRKPILGWDVVSFLIHCGKLSFLCPFAMYCKLFCVFVQEEATEKPEKKKKKKKKPNGKRKKRKKGKKKGSPSSPSFVGSFVSFFCFFFFFSFSSFLSFHISSHARIFLDLEAALQLFHHLQRRGSDVRRF